MSALSIRTLMFTLIVAIIGFSESHIRAHLQQPKDRQPRAGIDLTDPDSHTGDLKQYHAKV